MMKPYASWVHAVRRDPPVPWPTTRLEDRRRRTASSSESPPFGSEWPANGKCGRNLGAREGKAFPCGRAKVSADPFCGDIPATPREE